MTDTDEMMYCISNLMKAGYKIILAHTERYHYVIDGINTVRKLKQMGCLIQINAYSLVEESNERTRGLANEILSAHLADFIGSDAHRTTHRPPRLESGVEWIYSVCDKEYADSICYANASKYLNM